MIFSARLFVGARCGRFQKSDRPQLAPFSLRAAHGRFAGGNRPRRAPTLSGGRRTFPRIKPSTLRPKYLTGGFRTIPRTRPSRSRPHLLDRPEGNSTKLVGLFSQLTTVSRDFGLYGEDGCTRGEKRVKTRMKPGRGAQAQARERIYHEGYGQRGLHRLRALRGHLP